jgi:dynein heavy chain
MVEGAMEKRAKDKLGPVGGKQLVIFVDDLNMPKKTSFESPFQPPLELLRLWIDYGGWYDRQKCSWRAVLDSQLLGAMAPPGGGRNDIAQRLQSRFALINLTFPADAQIVRMFDAILHSKFVDYDNEIKALSVGIATATLSTYKMVINDFFPTPEKFHYVFNIRDVARVIQGVLMASIKTIVSPEAMLRLWTHECQRVFADRFIQTASRDEDRFRDILVQNMQEAFGKDWGTVMQDSINAKAGPMFCALLTEQEDGIVYEEVNNYGKIKQALEEKLENFNVEPKLIPMDLVLFSDAIGHVARIHRILMQPRGNAMLVGVGGSGRQSLTHLAAFIAGYSVFCIEITKNYRMIEFREDMKRLYQATGCEGKRTVFLFNDTQLKEEGFLEDINNILSSGEIPNLFSKDELPAICDAVRKAAVAAGLEEVPDQLWRFFISRVRTNLHIVLAMSPVGDGLRTRCRMYPGLVNSTTIDWFHTWPADALQEVAMKFLSDVQLEQDSYKASIGAVFAEMHLSVCDESEHMRSQLKRYNYVTPTNYLELVKGYKRLLAEKVNEIGSSAMKLANGLAKLEEARIQVEEMSVELEAKKIVVAQSQRDCEDLLVEIVSERRVADEQRKQVEAESNRISKEAEECNQIAADAEAELEIALPALEKAMEEVEKLDKGSVSEMKAYTQPPKAVQTVMIAVMTLMGKPPDWVTAKKTLNEANFLQQIKGFNKDNITNSILSKIKKFIDQPDFHPDQVREKSDAAGALCTWVHAMYIYASVAKEVAPKRHRAREANESLAAKQAALAEAQADLAEVTEKVNKLKQRYDASVNEKNRLHDEAEALEQRLDRADKLVNGLQGEYVRWQGSIVGLNSSLAKVVGDALVASAFLSYTGPFETIFRSRMTQGWLRVLKDLQLPYTANFDFSTFLARPTDVRDWNIQGLPADAFSTENGVIVTRSARWPLMIDPQGQANRWIRSMERASLRVVDLKMRDFLREIEHAVQYGMPVLIQNVLEELDPALEPLMGKQILKVGSREVIRIGDKDLDYSHDFKLYITTKLSNPHYTPEISTKATVVNFSVKREGLEAQLLGIVVEQEEPSLEQRKSELTVLVATGKRKLAELEDDILRLLSESKGSLLEDTELVVTLQTSKITSEEVMEQLRIAEDTEIQIDNAREGYRAAAVRAAIAYFVLDDMSRVDPMYQFSLDAYIALFCSSIVDSRTEVDKHVLVQKRCENINHYHTRAVYDYTCRGLFEAHKLLFSLQLCLKIMEEIGKIPKEELAFFCYGGAAVDRATQRRNPSPDWVKDADWDAVIELDKLPALSGIASGFEQLNRDWKNWYLSPKVCLTHLLAADDID